MRRFLSNLFLARVQKSETQAGVPVGMPWLAVLVLASVQRALPLVVGSTEAIAARPELRAEQGPSGYEPDELPERTLGL